MPVPGCLSGQMLPMPAASKPSRWYRPGSRGVRQKLARVLEATMNGPMGSAPGVRLTGGLRLRPVKKRRHGRYHRLFSRRYGVARGDI